MLGGVVKGRLEVLILIDRASANDTSEAAALPDGPLYWGWYVAIESVTILHVLSPNVEVNRRAGGARESGSTWC
jgi:hypothetical protein